MVALCTLMPACEADVETLPVGFPTRRGVATFFDPMMLPTPVEDAPYFKWVSSFDLLLTNGYEFARAPTREALHEQGCKLFLYVWTNAFYEHELEMALPEGRWRNELLADHPDWLLSPEPLPSAMGPPAYYFDFDNAELVSYLCTRLASFRAQTGYDGLFFDYAGVYGLPQEVAELWDQIHPDLPYDRALLGFFRRLREIDPQVLIFANQAYRSDEPLLGEVDYDMAESYATSFAWGPEVQTEEQTFNETFFRPWSGDFGIERLYRAIEERLNLTPPRHQFIYLDYDRSRYRKAEDGRVTTELDTEATYYSYCAAALWGRPSYCWSVWGEGHHYRGPLYFADLGAPLGDGPEQLDGLVLREYQRGLIAMMTGTDAVDVEYTLRTRTGAGLYDLFASDWVAKHGRQVRLHLEPSTSDISGVARPSARVYLKSHAK